MRLGFDLRIMRYPPGGTALYPMIAMERMKEHQPPGWDVVGLPGWTRLSHNHPLPAPARRATNLGLDAGWLTVGANLAAVQHRLDAWFTPASILPLALPRPSIAIVHNLAFLSVPELFNPTWRRVTEWLHRRAVARAARVITPTQYLRELIVERLGANHERVTVIPWGMDHLPEPAADSGVDLPRPYALFVGQTQPHWNVGVLIDAWQRDVPADLTLVICGAAGSDDAMLRRRVEAEGLTGRVIFAGHVLGAQLMALIRDARVFIDPSLAEGFGKPVIETMGYGIPCAVSSEGALKEVTQGAALVFDPHDPDAVADAVTRLHTDEGLRATLVEAGPRAESNFRWAKTAPLYWDEVERAVSGG